MSNKRPGMQQLVDRLLDGSEQRLSAAELDAVLAWLSGSDRHGGDALAGILGHALDHPQRRIAIYDRLDIQLFVSERLDLTGAHLAAGLDDELRRARYRRLMKAYHPDSYPDHADWLTPRSQAIHQSYARFRKGQPPESGGAPQPQDLVPKRPAQQHWPAARRSARLTPGLGPGPLSRLRTWLLGIDNLQQRILIGLVVICLVPVLYAYLAYKPYRAIQSADSVVEAPPTIEETDRPLAGEPDDDPRDPVPVVSDEDPELSLSMPEAVAPILPSWERPSRDESEGEREPIEPSLQRSAAGEEVVSARKPAPEASWLELAAWAETLSDTASKTLDRTSNPLATTAQDTSTPAEQALAETRERPEQSPEREVVSRNDRSARNTRDRAQTAPNSNNAGNVEDAVARTSSARQPEQATEEAPARVAKAAASERESRPEPETAREPPRRASAETLVAAVEPTPAPSETAPKEVVIVSEAASEAVSRAAEADAPDERTRRHIEELLAGYRTSFEKGWLEDFLDHFTSEPRENKHSGRGWFRSNYGWLFDNSERRRLELDITDITRADSHWTAVAQFNLQIDYGDRPNVRSSRQVRYRIETNEHDQLRIAAIEY